MADTGMELQVRELMDLIRELRLTIESLRKDLSARDKTIALQQEQLAYFQKKLFSSSSEKHSFVSEGQIDCFNLFDEAEMEAVKETEPEPNAEEEPAPMKTRKPKTKKAELLKGIPVQEKIIELPEAERFCSECGHEMLPAGVKFVRDEITYVPAKVTVTRIYAQTYFCPACKNEAAKASSDTGNHLVTAKAPEALIPHSMATAEVVAHVMYQKYANGVPLYRQEKDWKQAGLVLSRGRQARWITMCSEEYFSALYNYLHRLLLQRQYLMADETRVQVLNEPERKAEQMSYMWLYRTGEDELPPILLYKYTPTRARYNAEAFLEGFEGYLMTDGYQGYNDLPGVKRTCCWAHVRRYFHDAIPQGKKTDYADPAVQGMIYCDQLFAVEKHCKAHGYNAKQRYEYRLKKAQPVLEAFWKWLDHLKDEDKRSRLGKAYAYTVSRKAFLELYLEDGHCSLSNNLSENAIRPFCLGRKNWLFSESQAGADASAMVYTLVELAKAHHLNAEDYLTFILNGRPNTMMTDAELNRFLPWSDEARQFCRPCIAL